jgi:hypothetical protein
MKKLTKRELLTLARKLHTAWVGHVLHGASRLNLTPREAAALGGRL